MVKSPGLEEVVRDDLARQLGSLIDQIALLGRGPAYNEPTGIAATDGVDQIAFTWRSPAYADFVHAERLCAEVNVSTDYYSVITVRETYRLTLSHDQTAPINPSAMSNRRSMP